MDSEPYFPTVAGLDVSLTSTGVAFVAGPDEATVHRILSKGTEKDSLLTRRHRIGTLAGRIVRLVDAAEPDLVCIEQPAYSRVGGHTHDRSGLWWLVVFKLSEKYPLVEIAPSVRPRYATGRGNASKDEVLTAVVRRYPRIQVQGNDDADALVLAAMGSRHMGFPIEAKPLPLANLTGMAAIAWPPNLRRAAGVGA